MHVYGSSKIICISQEKGGGCGECGEEVLTYDLTYTYFL